MHEFDTSCNNYAVMNASDTLVNQINVDMQSARSHAQTTCALRATVVYADFRCNCKFTASEGFPIQVPAVAVASSLQ